MSKVNVREAPAGSEMNAAVARALGWTILWIDTLGGGREPMWKPPPGRTYRPSWSTDIEAAWELDGDGWRWRFVENDDELFAAVEWPTEDEESQKMAEMWGAETYIAQTLAISWESYDKSAVYALARCRLFLLAHGIEEIEICADS